MTAPERSVTVILNGADHRISEGTTVAMLLETLGLSRARVAVEVNGRVVRRGDLGRCALADHDGVEVVQFVGGG